MSARDHYALWLAVVRGELTEAEAADRWGLDVTAVRRICQVAEQGAMAALSTADPRGTARVTVSTEPADAAGGRVLGLLSRNPAFIGASRDRLEELTRAATLVVVAVRTPITDRLPAGPLVVSEGTLLAVDSADHPVDLIGAGAYRAPRTGRRLIPLTRAYVAALPATAVEDAGRVARSRLAAGAPVGGVQSRTVELPSATLGAVVLGDLVTGGAARPVQAVDETAPSLARRTPLIDALVRMVETGAATVVVTDSDEVTPSSAHDRVVRVVGAVVADDLPLPEEARAADLLSRLAEAPTLEGLATVPSCAHVLARSLLIAGTDVEDVGRLLAATSDHLMRRLLVVAEAELGPPPVDFAWLVFGSQARREPTPASDQDTGLLYSDGLQAEGHDWFARLGRWMTEALEACGFRPCPGGVMASRPEWRHDITGWQHTIRRWTSPTEPSRLIGADIGLDVRAVAGTGDLDAEDVADRLARVVADASRSELTAARLARAAVARRPPSATWGKVGRNPLGPSLASRSRRFDLKRDGIQPIIDLARVHTLVRGGTEVNTIERLAAAAAVGALSPDLAATLVEGLRLLTWTRMSAQLSGPEAAASDHVDWATLPAPLRTQFSETFGAIRTAQDALRARYRLSPGA